jgi:CO/xanthine dehydrogenase Mo-binding subunit
VEYEQLPVVNDLETSMKNEVLVHEDWSQYDCSSACFPVQGTNIGDQYHLKKGDVEAGFAQADEIVESDFTCGMLQHTTIETHTATGGSHLWGDPHLGARSVPLQQPGVDRQDLSCAHGEGAPYGHGDRRWLRRQV